MSLLNSTVLVIDHSPTVNRLLSRHLKRIGFSEILACETEDSGVKTFEDLVSSDKKLLVFLGYHFPDNIASSIVPQLFEIQPGGMMEIAEEWNSGKMERVERWKEGIRERWNSGSREWGIGGMMVPLDRSSEHAPVGSMYIDGGRDD